MREGQSGRRPRRATERPKERKRRTLIRSLNPLPSTSLLSPSLNPSIAALGTLNRSIPPRTGGTACLNRSWHPACMTRSALCRSRMSSVRTSRGGAPGAAGREGRKGRRRNVRVTPSVSEAMVGYGPRYCRTSEWKPTDCGRAGARSERQRGSHSKARASERERQRAAQTHLLGAAVAVGDRNVRPPLAVPLELVPRAALEQDPDKLADELPRLVHLGREGARGAVRAVVPVLRRLRACERRLIRLRVLHRGKRKRGREGGRTSSNAAGSYPDAWASLSGTSRKKHDVCGLSTSRSTRYHLFLVPAGATKRGREGGMVSALARGEGWACSRGRDDALR